MKNNKDFAPNTKILPRDKGGSVDLPDGTGGIIAMRNVNNLLEIYKIDRIFTLVHPNFVDPKKKQPERKMLIKTIKKGTSNKIIARCFLQLYDLLHVIHPRHSKKDEIVSILKMNRDLLLDCENAFEKLMEEQKRCINTLESNQLILANNVFTNFPEIHSLEVFCTSFLINAKKFIINSLKVLNIFFDSKQLKIDKIIEYLKDKYPQNNLISYLELVYPTVMRIIDFRNRSEHPKNGYKLTIKDFDLLNADYTLPMWYTTENEKYMIASDMKSLIDVLIVFLEIIFIESLTSIPTDQIIPIRIDTIPNSELNKYCPIKYVVYGEIGSNKYVHIGNSFGYEKNFEKYLE